MIHLEDMAQTATPTETQLYNVYITRVRNYRYYAIEGRDEEDAKNAVLSTGITPSETDENFFMSARHIDDDDVEIEFEVEEDEE
jgi:hypothetical protein